MRFPTPTALAPFTLTLVAVRHGGSPHPIRRALDPLPAPQHVAKVTLKFHLLPKGVFGFPGAELSPVEDNRAGTLHLWGTPASERVAVGWVGLGRTTGDIHMGCLPTVVPC